MKGRRFQLGNLENSSPTRQTWSYPTTLTTWSSSGRDCCFSSSLVTTRPGRPFLGPPTSWPRTWTRRLHYETSLNPKKEKISQKSVTPQRGTPFLSFSFLSFTGIPSLQISFLKCDRCETLDSNGSPSRQAMCNREVTTKKSIIDQPEPTRRG